MSRVAAARRVAFEVVRSTFERDAWTDRAFRADADPESAAIAHSVPAWLCRMWWSELGAGAARSLLAACNEPAETALRVNELRASPDGVREQLARAGISARRPEAEPPLTPREVL